MTTYVVETLGTNDRVLDRDEHATSLPLGAVLGPWDRLADGGEVAYGTAPAYLGGRRVRGRVHIRVVRERAE